MNERDLLEKLVNEVQQTNSLLKYQTQLSASLLEIVDGKSKQSQIDKKKIQNKLSGLLGNFLKQSGANLSAEDIEKGIKQGLEGFDVKQGD